MYLKLSDGRRLIDGMASWWSAIHGYNVPQLNAAASKQLEQMSHVMFGGITHLPAIELGRRLIAITPEPLQKVFLADSGSVSVEVAMKMALQYQYARGQPDRAKFMTFRGGYHGDTTGPMSVCDPTTGMHNLFAGFLPQHYFITRPPAGFSTKPQEAYLRELDEFFEANARHTAAFICEPVVQGAGGMHFYNPAYLDYLRDRCHQYGILLIFDEIATGFGRTGRLFASEYTVCPDIICLGKALTGGYLTLAATLCTNEVAGTIGQSNVPNLMHGPTFMGNPLACSIASASVDLLLSSDWAASIDNISSWAKDFFAKQPQLPPAIKDTRVLGGIVVIETHHPVDSAAIQEFFVSRGVWLRPFGRLIYTMPPYIIRQSDFEQMLSVMLAACERPELFDNA